MEDEVDEEVPTCPLCLEELDATDRAVKACQCGYQVCLWCLHTIRERLNRRCPACRTLYDEHNFKFDDINREQAAKEAKERKIVKKERERKEKLKEIERERTRALLLSQQKAKSNLKHARILQKNLVYVIGLSLTLAREEVIRRPDMFGRFGRIIRALVNRSHPFNSDAPGGPSISAYVQYARDVDAASAVRGMNNAVYDGREIRCAVATTKYCDALIRSSQVSDSSVTYHCGNLMCMYYHSTAHTDALLTREEVLARQLGPPPPAHLFESGTSSRRSTFNHQFHRSSNAHSNANVPSQHMTSRSTNRSNSTIVSSSAHASQKLRAQDNNSIPNNHHSPPSISSPVSMMIMDQNLSVIPSASTSTRGTPSSPMENKSTLHLTTTSSPRNSPPPSPPAETFNTRQVHSPTPSGTPQTSSPVAGPPAPVPLPSSATWASTQPGHPVSRSPVRRIRSTNGENINHSHPVAVPRKAEAPPGFEFASASRASPLVVPSRPPGFDSTPGVPRSEQAVVPMSDDDSLTKPPSTEHLSNSTTNNDSLHQVTPPPGFGGSTPVRSEPEGNARGEAAAAAAWLQEASADAVFSSNQERRPIRPVGDSVLKLTNNNAAEDGGRRNLQEVLSSIGGTLGVSSEIHNVQPPVSHLESRNSAAGIEHNGNSLFGHSNLIDPSQSIQSPPKSMDKGTFSSSNLKTGMRIGSFPNNLDQELKGGHGPYPLPSHTSVPSLSDMISVKAPVNIVRTAITLRGMRNRSRFTFAQDQVNQWDTQMTDAAAPTVSTSVADTGIRPVGTMDSFGVQYEPRHDGIPHVEDLEDVGLKKSNLNIRQMRSRFDFADQGSSPPRDSPMVPQVGGPVGFDSSVHISNPQSGMAFVHSGVEAKSNHLFPSELGQAVPLSDGFIDSRTQLPHNGKLGIVFPHPVKWSTQDSMPHMVSNYDVHVQEIMHPAGTSAMVAPSAAENMMAVGRRGNMRMDMGDARSIFRAGNNLSNVNVNEHGEVISGTVEGGLALPPPGFKEATSGISPDTIAGVETSANTGVASNVVTGGTRKETRINKDLTRKGTENTLNGGVKVPSSMSHDTKSLSSVVPNVVRPNGEGVNEGMEFEHGCDKISKNTSESTTIASTDVGVEMQGDPTNSETESAEDERKRSRAQRKRDRKTRQAKETAGRERKIAKESRSGNKAKSQEDCKNVPAVIGEKHDHLGNEMKIKRRKELVVGKDGGVPSESAGEGKEDPSRRMSVSELEKEVEAARVREAQLKVKLMEITRRLRSYDNVRN